MPVIVIGFITVVPGSSGVHDPETRRDTVGVSMRLQEHGYIWLLEALSLLIMTTLLPLSLILYVVSKVAYGDVRYRSNRGSTPDAYNYCSFCNSEHCRESVGRVAFPVGSVNFPYALGERRGIVPDMFMIDLLFFDGRDIVHDVANLFEQAGDLQSF